MATFEFILIAGKPFPHKVKCSDDVDSESKMIKVLEDGRWLRDDTGWLINPAHVMLVGKAIDDTD